MTEENQRKNIEILELKQLFYDLQEKQQENLMKLIKKSAENLLSFSKTKEKEKEQDLKKLKEIEKEFETYKPMFKSPKLDLILQQQKALIEEIKEKTQGEKLKVTEFQMESIEEIKEIVQKRIEENREKLKEGVGNKEKILMDEKYLELIESKKKESMGFIKVNKLFYQFFQNFQFFKEIQFF